MFTATLFLMQAKVQVDTTTITFQWQSRVMICFCVCVRVRTCAYVRGRACVRACVRARVVSMCGNVERQVVYLYSAKFMCKPASAVGEILLERLRQQQPWSPALWAVHSLQTRLRPSQIRYRHKTRATERNLVALTETPLRE